MANLVETVERKAFGVAVDATLKNLNKDREKALLQIVDLAEKFMGNNFSKEAYDGARAMIKNPDHKWMRYVNRLLDETDSHVAKMTALNLGFQAAFLGTKTIRKMREVHNCNIPWLILFDPTMACNMHCKGCWSGTYGRNQFAAIHADEYRRKQPLVSSTGKICRKALRQYEKRSTQQAALFKNITSSYWHSEHDRSAEKCRPVNS